MVVNMKNLSGFEFDKIISPTTKTPKPTIKQIVSRFASGSKKDMEKKNCLNTQIM